MRHPYPSNYVGNFDTSTCESFVEPAYLGQHIALASIMVVSTNSHISSISFGDTTVQYGVGSYPPFWDMVS